MAPLIPRNPTRLPTEVERLQQNMAERSNGRDFLVAPRWNDARTEVEYLYRKHQLICDEADLDAVLRAFDRIPEDRPVDSDGPVGLKILDVGDRDAADLADKLAELLGDGVVTPNHVLDAQGHSIMCPATEPLPWVAPMSDLPEPVGSGKARVSVIDTGHLPAIHKQSGYARFASVDKKSQPDDEVFARRGVIRPYGGHGSATSAVLLSVSGAKATTVHIRDCLVGGGVDEITIVEDLETVVTAGADVISIQAGTYTRARQTPIAFNAFARKVLCSYPDTVLVAAAGNDNTDRPFWPAAYNWCTAVGALTRGGDARTGWTNYGHWVDVYATGENVVVPFPNGKYTYLDGTSADFKAGYALWSGTSFAAPAVAGFIARRMIERGIKAPQARDIVLADAAISALPSTGPRLLV
ncbi:MAG TPA: S8/S53 family peptidase [Actinomycetes bacterium]|nr:S8/S53 family peptidase [Actinomycetes bacterium]